MSEPSKPDLTPDGPRHHPELQRPPELPPMPARRALASAGILLLVLLCAGGLTMSARVSHERALVRATEMGTVPSVAVVNPQSERPEDYLVLPGSLQA